MLDLRWIAQSRKAQIALSGLATITLLKVLEHFGMPAAIAEQVSTAIVDLGAAWIVSIAIEDHGKNNPPSPAGGQSNAPDTNPLAKG